MSASRFSLTTLLLSGLLALLSSPAHAQDSDAGYSTIWTDPSSGVQQDWSVQSQPSSDQSSDPAVMAALTSGVRNQDAQGTATASGDGSYQVASGCTVMAICTFSDGSRLLIPLAVGPNESVSGALAAQKNLLNNTGSKSVRSMSVQ